MGLRLMERDGKLRMRRRKCEGRIRLDLMIAGERIGLRKRIAGGEARIDVAEEGWSATSTIERNELLLLRWQGGVLPRSDRPSDGIKVGSSGPEFGRIKEARIVLGLSKAGCRSVCGGSGNVVGRRGHLAHPRRSIRRRKRVKVLPARHSRVRSRMFGSVGSVQKRVVRSSSSEGLVVFARRS